MSDCPICMNVIEGNKNCVITECGHCFHASCLMSNVAHNGFGCPYCRTAMTQNVPSRRNHGHYEDDDEDDDEDEDDEIEDDIQEEYALRGFRFMQNTLEGQEHDPQDIEDEEYDNTNHNNDDDNETITQTTIRPELPDAAYIAKRLFEDGITMEKIIKCLMNRHEEYMHDEIEIIDDEIYDKMCTYIDRFIMIDRFEHDEDDDDTRRQQHITFSGFMIPKNPSHIYVDHNIPTSPPSIVV